MQTINKILPVLNFSLYSAWIELRYSFARTILGPFWNSLGQIALISLLGLLFGAILKNDLQGYSHYIPFLASGVITWSYLSSCINESCSIFVRQTQTLRNMEQPFIAIPLAVIFKNTYVFIQNLFIALLIYLIVFKTFPAHIFFLFIGIILLTSNIIWICLLATIASIRFRDLPQFISGTLYVGFLLTPIIWTESFLGRFDYLLNYNPAYHLITIVREPLLGTIPSLKIWLAGIILLIFGGIITSLIYYKTKKKIYFWF